MFFYLSMLVNALLLIVIYRLYFYKRVYQERDFVYIPNIQKQRIYLSQRLQKITSYDVTLDEFVKQVFSNEAVSFYRHYITLKHTPLSRTYVHPL